MIEERQRRQRLLRKLSGLALGGNAAGALLLNFYFLLVNLPINAASLLNLGINLVVIMGLLWVMFARGSRTQLWERWYLECHSPSDPPALKIREQALDLPLQMAIVSLLMWGMATLVFSMLEMVAGQPDLSPGQRMLFLVSNTLVGTCVSGSLAAVIVYFSVERLWQPEIPIFFPEGTLQGTHVFRVTLPRRIQLLFVIMLVPLMLMGVTTYRYEVWRSGGGQWDLLIMEWFMVGLGVLMAIVLARTLGVSMVNSVAVLQTRMARVREGDLETRIPVLSNDEFGELAEGFNAMVSGLRREAIIRHLFERYVTPQVAQYAILHGARLGGQMVEATVLFSDIRDFTSLSERIGPEVLIALLNRYFQAMAAVIGRHGGLINKFGGDSILAIFGTPLNPSVDHPDRAARAALEMLAVLESLNADQLERGEPELRIGIGVTTGPVVVGNVGSEERMEYTVLGDTVNLASRLQDLTKEHQTAILVSESVAASLESGVISELIGQIEVRGRQARVLVYTLMPASPAPMNKEELFI